MNYGDFFASSRESSDRLQSACSLASTGFVEPPIACGLKVVAKLFAEMRHRLITVLPLTAFD